MRNVFDVYKETLGGSCIEMERSHRRIAWLWRPVFAITAIFILTLTWLHLNIAPEHGNHWTMRGQRGSNYQGDLTLTYRRGQGQPKVTYMDWSKVDPGWLPGTAVDPAWYFVSQTEAVNNWSFRRVINSGATCGNDGGTDILLVVVVVTRAEDGRDREFIRGSWGQGLTSEPNVKVVFLCGGTTDVTLTRKLRKESALYSDVIRYDFHDSRGYQGNETIAAMLSLAWFSEACPRATFLLVTHSDVVYDPRLLILTVSGQQGSRSGVMGHVVGGVREPWDVGYLEYPLETLPAHVTGSGGFVISGWAVPKLAQLSLHVPLIHRADIYITGILTTIAGK